MKHPTPDASGTGLSQLEVSLHLATQEQPEKRQCPITQRPKHRAGKRAPHLAPDGSGDPL